MSGTLQPFRVRRVQKSGLAASLALAVTAASAGAVAVAEDRHFDARRELNRGLRVEPSDVQQEALADLAVRVRELTFTRDEALGTIRSLGSHVTYLTDARPGDDALVVALDFVRAHRELLGLEESDLVGFETSDRVFSSVTGTTHIYLRQRFLGIPVWNGLLQVNVSRDGRVVSVTNGFVPGLASAVRRSAAAFGAAEAVRNAALHAGLAVRHLPRRVSEARGLDQATRLEAEGVSRGPIEARLMWLPLRKGDVELVWNLQLETPDGSHYYDYTVSAGEDGAVWTRVDWTAADQYTVYPLPVESPNHTSPVPPGDGRVTVADPADATASPFGWHDTNGSAGAEYTIPRGNNVHAYEDRDSNNAPPASQPDCGPSLLCNFPLDLTQTPAAYIPGAVANLFYWNNVIHDVQYRYGFDEAAGNFQQNNYGRGGAGGDYVQAEAQDGSGTNNANFSTPPDGSRPRMQMYVWTAPNPDKDGDLDNGIIIHEYGHGISNRLVGGPSNVSCLGNSQQPGEGLSDWWALAYTAEPGDQGTDPRGIGTYALDQPTSGPGIRTQRYSTDPTVNTWTYASINGMAIPHGVGSVWAQAAWEVYWALVDHWGFDENLYDATGPAGNQRMMLYVNEGLKNTACSPTFTDVRDGIIQAAIDNHGGEDVCRIWEAFAAFGLGVDAVSGGPNSTSPTNGFQVPAECGGGGGSGAVYDPVLRAPKCGTAASSCDSGTLLNGRDGKGPEPNAPNTISGSCADGTSGSYHSDESNDRIIVQTLDGTDLAPGKTVRVDATVWAWSTGSADRLDLYYAANAASPSWTFIATLTPPGGGQRTLSASYTLPSGNLQAVRARFRYQGSASPCATGPYDDHDDLVFTVGAGGPDTTPPTTAITAPASGATLTGTTTVTASASDDTGVTRVEFFVDAALSATDTSAPYSFAWDTTTAADGGHALQSRAYDAAGNVGTSATVSVTVDNNAPTTAITAPLNGATVTGTTTVTASASDAVGVTRVEFLVDGALEATDTTAPYSFAWNTTTLANGSHSLQSKAYDAAGHVGSSSVVTVEVSNAGPVVVFFDDFETSRGWVTNPNGTDTATTGQWERGDPQATSYGGAKQLGTTVSGVNDLVTGRLAGFGAGSYDIDNGVTSIRSPSIALPAGNLTLSFSYYLAHLSNSSSADFLRVKVVGATTGTVLEELGAANNDNAAWATASVSLNAWAGQTVYILIEAADAAGASLVEAAVDDVRIVLE